MPFGSSNGFLSRRDTTTIAQRDNAGTGQFWVPSVPKGRLNPSTAGRVPFRPAFGRPFGTWSVISAKPSVETLGYSRMSLRDKDRRSGRGNFRKALPLKRPCEQNPGKSRKIPEKIKNIPPRLNHQTKRTRAAADALAARPWTADRLPADVSAGLSAVALAKAEAPSEGGSLGVGGWTSASRHFASLAGTSGRRPWSLVRGPWSVVPWSVVPWSLDCTISALFSPHFLACAFHNSLCLNRFRICRSPHGAIPRRFPSHPSAAPFLLVECGAIHRFRWPRTAGPESPGR